ncbi:3-deoxy-D-manno-octulosonic acid transferase [hydrothermal vent metagenome]|uniref:3-deoxy-D-manno-octulosonic acid transferase n=1 Tax=hydrothermal vent metagenome TaxID=652676 RepID=A0A3B0RNC0_9ZZZZ
MSKPFAIFTLKTIGVLLGLALLPVLLFRAIKGKEEPKRLGERWGASKVARPSGRLVWIHGASVGESVLGLSLAAKMAEQQPELSFLFTSGTRTSAQMLAKQMQRRQCHQYLPMDTPGATARFIRHWRPDLAIFLESEIWPNLIFASKTAGIPLALLNARMNQASRDKWQKLPTMFSHIIGQFNWISAADTATADFLDLYRTSKPDVPGNLKLLQPVAKQISKAEQDLQRQTFGRTPVWLAASTHAGEEQILLQVHQKILQQHPQALLILLPRHPERGQEIETICQQAELQTSRWTMAQQPKGSVLIADTIGEMPLWLNLADIVFIGGSLGAGKGHNPLEAIRAKKPVLSGTHIASFAQLYAELTALDAVTLTDDQQQIGQLILQRFANLKTENVSSKRANDWVEAQSQALETAVIQPLLALMKAGKNESA